MVEDRLWELIEPLLPPRPAPKGPGGRPRVDERAALEGILLVLHTGCRWRDLPPCRQRLRAGEKGELTGKLNAFTWTAVGQFAGCLAGVDGDRSDTAVDIDGGIPSRGIRTGRECYELVQVPGQLSGKCLLLVGDPYTEQVALGPLINSRQLNNYAYAPFGGTGASGNGRRFGSQSAWDEFTQWPWITSRHQAHGFPF